MIPFARMMKYGQVITDDIVLDINFSRQSVGDNSVTDFSASPHIFQKLNAGAGSVVYDSTLDSNVMFFNGAVFSTPMVLDLQLSTKKFEIDVMYKSTSSAIQVIYGTGYYPDVTNRVSGMCHQIGQYVGNDQYFLDNGSTFQRNLLDQSDTSVWQRLVYTRLNGTTNIKRYRNSVLINSSSNYPEQTFANGTSFGIGGYYPTPGVSNFLGYMQYLRVKIL